MNFFVGLFILVALILISQIALLSAWVYFRRQESRVQWDLDEIKAEAFAKALAESVIRSQEYEYPGRFLLKARESAHGAGPLELFVDNLIVPRGRL